MDEDMRFSSGFRFGNLSRCRSLKIFLACATVLFLGSSDAFGKVGESSPKGNGSKVSEKTGNLAKDQVVVLGDNLATVDLPPEYVFIGPKEAAELLKKAGSPDDKVIGVIALRDESKNDYCIVCDYFDIGYVDDEDAEQLNADQLLQSMQDDVKASNENRKKMNFPPMYISGWAHKPFCKKASHQVVWGVQVKTDDADKAPVDTINYSTRILGRRGVLCMNLVTSPEYFEQNKTRVAALLNATKFNAGQAYGDFKPDSDKMADFGVAGLILGGGALAAAAKSGVLAMILKWLLVPIFLLKKFIILVIIGIGSIFPRLSAKWKMRRAAAKKGSSDRREGEK